MMVNCCVVPLAKLRSAGLMAIDTSTAEVIVTVELAVFPWNEAVICAVPGISPVTTPLEETVATVAAAEVQVVDGFRFCVLPSENVPVKVSCCAAPGAKLAPLGLMAIETRVAELTMNVAWLCSEPDVAWMVTVPGVTPVARPELLTVAKAGFELLQVTALERFSVWPLER